MKQAKEIAGLIVLKLEGQKISLIHYFIVFFFIVQFRFFIESFSTTVNYFDFPALLFFQKMVHFALSFLVLALSLAIFFNFVTRTPVLACIKTTLIGFIIILWGPLFDLVLTEGRGQDIYYLAPGAHINVLMSYLTYFVKGNFHGASYGIQSEVLIGLMVCFIYFRIKKISWMMSLFYSLLVYTIIFLWGASPFFIKWLLEMWGPDFNFFYLYDDVMMIYFFLGLFFVLLIWASLLDNAKKWFSFFLSARTLLFTFMFLFLLGVMIAFDKARHSAILPLFVRPDFLIKWSFCIIALFFNALFIRSLFFREEYRDSLPIFLFILVAFYAMVSGIHFFLLVTIVSGTGYFFAAQPLELKQFWPMTVLVLPLGALALVILGYLTVFKTLYYFPKNGWLVFCLFSMGVLGLYIIRIFPKKLFLQGPS